MHSRFMEFFGNYLILAAGWQKLVEQSSPSLDAKPDIKDMAELGRLFQKIFNSDGPAEPAFTEYSRIWQQAIENFQSVFNPHARMWGWIPQAEYQVLQEKCDSLEKTIRKKDEIIFQLRSLLEEKGLGQSELLQRFQSLIQDQNDEFQTFMKNFGDAVLKTDGRKPKAKG
jgi:hypothetical protein